MAVDPNRIDKGDDNLLIYYYFDAAPVSGVAIENQADNGPSSTDLNWYSVHENDNIPGVNGLYGIDLSTATEDGVEYSTPGQWGGRNMYAASGNLIAPGGKLATRHHWKNYDGWSGNSVSNALSTGDFSFGGWLKVANANRNLANEETLVTFCSDTGTPINQSMHLRFRDADYFQFYYRDNAERTNVQCASTASGDINAMTGWNFITVTVSRTADANGNYVYFYLNGELEGFGTSAYWGVPFTGGNIIEYMSLGGMGESPGYQSYQGNSVWRDFWVFDKALSSGEMSYIFNNDISKASALKSTTNSLLLWYRFTEPSGTPLKSWATNTPTGLKYEYESGLPLDTKLQWYDDVQNGVDGLYSVDGNESGIAVPNIWSNDFTDSRVCVSGNTSVLYHALRGADIHNSEIAHTLSSGSFTAACWFNFATRAGAPGQTIFAFDEGSNDNLTFAANPKDEALYRFAFNDDSGSNNYLYNNIVDGNEDFQWNHICFVHTAGGDADGKYGRFYINGVLGGTTTNPEIDSLRPTKYLTFFNNHDEWIDDQMQGAVKDFVLLNTALDADSVSELYNNGVDLITTVNSGIFGGYVAGRTTNSGIIGGYSHGRANQLSGILGGFGYGRWMSSGILGGYVGAATRSSGILGGFIYASGIASGLLGGYCYGIQRTSGILGGYTYSVKRASGILGGFVNGGLAGSGIFDASFSVKAISYSDFDLLAHVYAQGNAEFDLQATVYRDELPPYVVWRTPDYREIEYPEGSGAQGHNVPVTYWFSSSGVAVDGKSMNKVIYDFGDATNKVFATASGSNGDYAYTHSYNTSGIYISTCRGIDSNGMTNSDAMQIHLASGVPMPSVTLSATPQKGYAPLSVDFDYTITNIPNGVTITSKVLKFGNGQSSINPNTTYVYTEAGIFIPTLVVTDSRGFKTTDSLFIGVNN